MKRTNLNATIDAVAAALSLVLLSSGLLIWLRLPPGSGHSSTVWSLDRHEWGDLHAWVAMGLLATILVHLALHWKWIVSVVSGQNATTKRRRKLAGGVVLGVALLAAASPFIAPVESSTHTVRGRDRVQEAVAPIETHSEVLSSINGRSTLADAAAETGATVEDLAAQLGLSPTTDGATRLGPLARDLGMPMSELRERLAGAATR